MITHLYFYVYGGMLNTLVTRMYGSSSDHQFTDIVNALPNWKLGRT